jgi:predicted Zn-dependent protease
MSRVCYAVLVYASLLLSTRISPLRAQTQNSQSEGEATAEKSTGSKIGDTLKRGVPDCISIIFHTCKDNSGRNAREEERQQQELARAAKRCEDLQKARPKAAATVAEEAPHPDPLSNESSSRSIDSTTSAPYCTPQDLLAAEHDVEVGDFNFKDKNYRGAEMRYRSALDRLPGEPIATLHLARVLEKQGKSAEAQQQYESYMTWGPTGKDAEEAQTALKRLASNARKQ